VSYVRVLHRNALVYRRYWRGSLFFSFLSPLLFVGAIGLGVGALVAQRSPEAFGPGGYLAFFSTGMLAAAAMNTATFESSWPISSKFNWGRNYEAMYATPLRVADLFFGEMAWVTLRLFMVAIPFYAVMWAFGVPALPTAPLAIPAAVLTGAAFAAAMTAYSATVETGDSFSWFFRFVITPLFLFSGTFYPLDRLPGWVEGVAAATPLYHGIELVRGLVIYGTGPFEAALHLGYLAAFFAVASAIGIRNYTKKLVT
jgi:lipooligosaccharide transport system permease protein